MNRIVVAQELVKFARELTAGTWALPESKVAARVLLDIIQQMEKGEVESDLSPTGILYDYFGDDKLFDELDQLAKPYLKSCATAVKRRVKDFAKMGADTYANPKAKEAMDWLASQIR
jgi:hypothetical protein